MDILEKRYLPFDPFILAHNVRQVYYVSYPSSRKDKKGWCVAIKTKPRGCIESIDMEDDVLYQIDEMAHVNEVIKVEGISEFQHSLVDVEEVEGNFEEEDEEDNEEEFEDSEMRTLKMFILKRIVKMGNLNEMIQKKTMKTMNLMMIEL